MTVTITTKHHEVATDDNDNETCCTTEEKMHPQDYTQSLLDDLPPVKEDDCITEEVVYDEIYYEKSRVLLEYQDAPEYLKHNPFIRKGYRQMLSTELCIRSLFWWTNETINIWSHIFGLFLFLCLTVYDFMILRIQATWGDKIIVAIFLTCFVSCMGLSAMYHTFSCRSEVDCYRFLSYDLFGIALSLLAVYTSGIYYAFWCETLLVPRVLGMYGISGTAFLIYITKIPERFCAGRFDFIGHSHNWWHLFVLLALYYWHNSGLVYIEYRLNHACPNKMKFP
ncbi:unnamed protein product [Acanthoscelides obtectus]|uniref:Progestin and adipoQ receptor family member 3 n=1 Tax=Acanthoscelides obtectus TaxID=200917 RepID=A0A9P0PUU6_ACAOB|nr:unnamed protein product [Acanthoscelides obtectus]CAK1671490.1 Progestin and adipoQ receptor family member 3 [Acanthoscelides obtectus]